MTDEHPPDDEAIIEAEQTYEKDLLRRKARELWGTEWFLRTIEFATGREQYEVVHTASLPAPGYAIREQMAISPDKSKVAIQEVLYKSPIGTDTDPVIRPVAFEFEGFERASDVPEDAEGDDE